MRQVIPIGVLGVLGMVGGCKATAVTPNALDLLPKREQLIRLSMDLRGIHPTEDELESFDSAENPDSMYADFADQWIEDPLFIGRMKEIFNQKFLVRNGQTYFDPAEGGLAGIDERVLADDIANEPLELLEYTIVNELPYSYMVTAPHTMANPDLAKFWNIDYPDDANGGWVPAQYNDGRPEAGMLSMTTTWQKYPSMGGNANRHRANAISKMFLCDDYLSRPIVLNRAAVDQLTISPEEAINTNTGCQACHSTLDPIAGNLFGFFNYDDTQSIDQTRYRPENEEEWRYYSGKEPGYYGHPTGNLQEFAQTLSKDSRFGDCATRNMWEGLTQREMTDDDWPEVSVHRDVFENSGENVKDVVRSIVNSDAFKSASATDPDLNDRLAGRKEVSPEQLSSLIKQVTGYVWLFGGRDGLKDNSMGLPVLSGGIDSDFVTVRSYVPSVGAVYVQERLGQSAGYWVAQHDLDPGRTEEAKLLNLVTVNDTPSTAHDAFVQQIQELYLNITGIPLAADATEPDELMGLWTTQYSVDASATHAWAGVISAVLRDPRVLFY